MDLSVLIPSRNEMFVSRTIEDILEHIEGDTEIICVLDGAWADPPIDDHERVTLIYHPVSVGQRAATNEAARLSSAKYVMKVDAHCAFDQGFDVKMMADMQDDWCMVPIMRNLHVFDWVCPNGHRRYQGHSGPCEKCGEPTERDIVWISKTNPQSTSYCFDPEPHFQYFRDFKKRPEGKGNLTETMSLQGSCFMMTREKYHELNVCDEAFGSWGSQGIEVACKVWLSGGRVVVNHKTWYAHCFRTKGGDWGFPYPLSGKQTKRAKLFAKDLFFANKWPQQVRPLSWLVERFWPVPGWSEEDLAKIKEEVDGEDSLLVEGSSIRQMVQRRSTHQVPPLPSLPPPRNTGGQVDQRRHRKGIVYYTDNRLDPTIMTACQNQLKQAGLPIVSVSLQPLNEFGQNIILDAERGKLTMFRQILAGLEASDADIIFFCEHDVLYHKSHFDFTPEKDDLFYYNQNSWRVDAKTGKALFHYASSTSGLCAHWALLLEHYRKRVGMVEANGFSNRMGYEPGTHGRKERVDDYKSETWMSEYPNLDIRHGKNLTPTRWDKSQFRNKRFTKGWTIADEVPGWGVTKGHMGEILDNLSNLC